MENLEELKNIYPEYFGKVINSSPDLAGKQIGKWSVLYRTLNQNNRAYYLCQCECGTIRKVRGSNLANQKTLSCGCTSRYLSDNLYLGKKVGELTIINIISSKQVECKCSCGNVITTTKSNLNSHNTTSCGCQRFRDGVRVKQNLIGQKFGKLTVMELTNKFYETKNGKESIWKCQCDCGNLCYARRGSLIGGTKKSCGCLLTGRIMLDLTGQIFGSLKVIEPIRQEKRHWIWLCECLECGSICEVYGYALKNGNTKSCGCLRSTQEKNIATLLQEVNIDFNREIRFSDCKNENNYNLPFDFGIINNDNIQYLIEYDGIQHFKTGTGWNTFEQVQKNHKHDLIKNKYCFDNNIPLIRIPYDKKYTINDLKLETTRFLLTPQNEIIYYQSRLSI